MTCYKEAVTRQREKVVVFMPAYCAARSLRRVCEKIPPGYVDDIVVVDDHSEDSIDAVAASLGLPLSDFRCGFRAYRRPMLEHLAWQRNADDYLFNFQIIAQAHHDGFRIGEVLVVCRYFPGATQIDFRKAMKYGVGALRTLGAYRRPPPSARL